MTASRNGPAAESPGKEAIDWAAALSQHQRWLRVVVLARLGEAQAVDEVLQEVSLAAVRQRAPVRDPQRVPAWLYRLAVRQAQMYRRRMGRQRNLLDRYVRHVGPIATSEAAGDPLSWLLSDERRQLIGRALDCLARRDAEILMLKYTQDWSYRELAGRMGISESAVEARLHRARKRLRAELVRLEVIEVSA